MRKLFLIIFILILIININLNAQVGNNGPDILRIMNSSSMISMGGIGLASGNAIDGLFSNPSYILNADCLEVSMMHLIWMNDYNIEYLSGVYPSSIGNFGLGLFYYHQPQDNYIDDIGEKTGLILNNSDAGVMISYSQVFFNIPFGATVKYINQTLVNYSSSSILFDLGMKQGLIANPGVVLFGLGIRNIGSGPTFIDEKTSVPIQVPFELGYKLKSNITEFGIYSGLYYYSNGEFDESLGAELGFLEKYRIRLGYKFGYDMQGFSLGVGVEQNIKNVDFIFDYGFIAGEGLGATHSLQLTVKFSSIGEIGNGVQNYKEFELKPVVEFLHDVLSGQPGTAHPLPVKKAWATSVEKQPSGETFYAWKAFDDDDSTRWSSEKSDPQVLTADLGQVAWVSNVNIKWEAAAAKSYHIDISMDNFNWKTVYDTENGQGNVEDIKFKPEKAQYVRMVGRTRLTTYGYSIFEFRIYGLPVSATPVKIELEKTGNEEQKQQKQLEIKVKSATASSTQSDEKNVDPGNVIDGDLTTRWISNPSDPQWIALDLGDIYSINKVWIKWEAAYASSYEIQLSTDNINWKAVYTTDSGSGGEETCDFTPEKGKYVRIYGKQRGTHYGYSIYEIKVYKDKE